jgi:hypothetical protein
VKVRAALLLGLLSACADTSLPGTRALSLYGGAVTVQGPQGYCVDRAASDPDSGFAVLGGCALLTTLQLMPDAPGLITVQVGEAGSAAVTGAEADLLAVLRSPAGTGLLSRTGAPVQVRDSEIGDGIVLLELDDSGPPLTPDLDRQEWRTFLDLGDRLATISLRGFARAPLSRGDALSVMSDAIRTLRATNRTPG